MNAMWNFLDMDNLFKRLVGLREELWSKLICMWVYMAKAPEDDELFAIRVKILEILLLSAIIFWVKEDLVFP